MTTKASINSDNTVTLSCPRCKKSRDLHVSRFKGQRDVSVKCPCGNAWSVQLDYRQSYRKKTEMKGTYRFISEDKKHGDAGLMTVIDLSHNGVRMKFMDFPFALEVGNLLNIKFNLDDKNHSLVNRDVVVKNIHPPYVGARFHRKSDEDNIIGFYLFN
ncbi:MAG: PilZ domain-containing protein [Thermodesulfobacteriota bacterium]